MKKMVLLTLMSLMILSCNKDETGLTGEWKLVAQLMDPGDGSRVFTAVESEKTITFFKNGKLESNKDLCYPLSASPESSKGTYSIEDSTLNIRTCSGNTAPTIWFSLSGDSLILSYLCIEGCGEKYVRIE